MNKLFNDRDIRLNKRRVYLGIIGNKTFFEKHNVFKNDFFPDQFFLNTEGENVVAEAFKVYSYSEVELEEVLETMMINYLWESEKLSIQENYFSEYNATKIEKGIGFGASLGGINYIRNKSVGKPYMLNYGFTGYRRSSKNWKLYWSFFMGLRFPNMKKKMKNEIQGQIDMSEMSSGEDVTVHIDTDLKARIYANMNIEPRRYFSLENRKIRPFVGTGLSYTFFLDMKGRLDTTITVNSSNMQSGGGLSGGGSGFSNMKKLDNQDMDVMAFQSLGALFSTGFEYPLNSRVLFNSKLTYHLPFNTFNQKKSTINSFDIQFGLVFKLKRKKIKFVEYIRTK
ncbi:hypothetical protein [Salinivirga cyanobacteriivorans]|uniref:hypothetical protein n=1 Tax=Salinivirga cyanobacteriivorans TaxID=1307839 RepID=UPI0012FD2C99|nr:hypothetical protein [Salinivirga cyanobacteriivorans]